MFPWDYREVLGVLRNFGVSWVRRLSFASAVVALTVSGNSDAIAGPRLNQCMRVLALCGTGLMVSCQSDLASTKSLGKWDGVNIAAILTEKAPNSPFFTTTQPLSPHFFKHHKAIVQKELQKYPQGLLDNNVENIFLCVSCTIFGDGAGGFFNPLYPSDVMVGYSSLSPWNQEIVHHELAHLFWHRHGTSEIRTKWVSANGVPYKGSDWELISSSPEMRQQGFISPYSQKNFSEDFAEVAAWLWTDPKSLFEESQRHEALRKKTVLTIEFYQRLDPRLDVDYFLNLQTDE